MSDEVRRPKSEVQSPESGVRRPPVRRPGPVGQGFSLADEEIDRAVRSITDISPSAAVKANVMGRVAEARRGASSGVRRPASGVRAWRLAFAAAAVVLVAVSAWLVMRPVAPTQRTGARAAGLDVTLPPSSAPSSAGATTQMTVPRAPARSGRDVMSHRVSAAATASPRAAAIDEMVITPLLPPDPVEVPSLTLQPMEVERIEIPPIRIGPVDAGDPGERGR